MSWCIFSDREIVDARGNVIECDSGRQEHHVVPQQRIKRKHRSLVAAFRRGGPKPWNLGNALRDSRFKLRICWAHHQLVEGRSLKITAAELPDSCWEAADQYGLRPSLEADFGVCEPSAP